MNWNTAGSPNCASRGALAVMLVALVSVAFNQIEEGRFADAEVTIAEGRTLSEATGFRAHLGLFACAELTVLARRGREAAARTLAEQMLPRVRGARLRAGTVLGAVRAVPAGDRPWQLR